MNILNKKDFSFVLHKKSNVVITGDSLAYNRYDYMTQSRINAWECYPGMESWSFQLRDYIISNQDGFIKGRDLEINEDKEILYFSESSYKSKLPFEYVGISIKLEKDEYISFKNISSGYLYIMTDPEYGDEISIDHKKCELKSNDDVYCGYEIKCVQYNGGKICCKSDNVRLNIIGFNKVGSMVHLTGSGSKTTKWLYENLDERVNKYKPDVLIMIIGANDRRNSTPVESKESLVNIIENVKSDILLLSSPHSTASDPDNGNLYIPDEKLTKPILDGQYDVVNEYNIPFIDMFKFFNLVDSAEWRFDNVHLSIKGNDMVFNYIKREILGG